MASQATPEPTSSTFAPTFTRFPTVSPKPTDTSISIPTASTGPTLTKSPDASSVITDAPVGDSTATAPPTLSSTTDDTNSTQGTMAPESSPTDNPGGDGTPTSTPTVVRDQDTPTPAPFVEAAVNTARPSGQPPACSVSGGSFGSAFGNPTPVTFGYEVETDPVLESGPFASAVLPDLEEAMTNFLLPVLFPGTCSAPSGGGDTTTTFRSGAGRRRLEVIGVASRPTDQVSTSVECRELLVDSNSCIFVNGQLTINYVQRPGETVESFVRLVLERLRFGMDSDALLDAHPSIQRVSFIIGLDDLPFPTMAPSDQDRLVDDEDDGILWWPWVVIGGALFIACCGVMCFLRTRRPPITPPRDASRSGVGDEAMT